MYSKDPFNELITKKKTFTIINSDGTKQKIKVSSEASILTKRDKTTKVLFGVVFVIFAIYSL